MHTFIYYCSAHAPNVCMYACMYVYHVIKARQCRQTRHSAHAPDNRVCVYVCIYVCMYVCMHACMHACTHACIYVYHVIKARPCRQTRHSAHAPDNRVHKARPDTCPDFPNRQPETGRYTLGPMRVCVCVGMYVCLVCKCVSAIHTGSLPNDSYLAIHMCVCLYIYIYIYIYTCA